VKLTTYLHLVSMLPQPSHMSSWHVTEPYQVAFWAECVIHIDDTGRPANYSAMVFYNHSRHQQYGILLYSDKGNPSLINFDPLSQCLLYVSPAFSLKKIPHSAHILFAFGTILRKYCGLFPLLYLIDFGNGIM
jgi:hypothetical protein